VTSHQAIATLRAASRRPTGWFGSRTWPWRVLPLHEDGTVTLVGQNRLPHGDYVWEIPEGGARWTKTRWRPPSASCARRPGLRPRLAVRAATLQLSNATTDERGVGFLAMDFEQGETEPDETEDIALARVPFREALDVALAGWMPDLLTVAMLLRAHHMAVAGELRPNWPAHAGRTA
jgi:hypothetical protein